MKKLLSSILFACALATMIFVSGGYFFELNGERTNVSVGSFFEPIKECFVGDAVSANSLLKVRTSHSYHCAAIQNIIHKIVDNKTGEVVGTRLGPFGRYALIVGFLGILFVLFSKKKKVYNLSPIRITGLCFLFTLMVAFAYASFWNFALYKGTVTAFPQFTSFPPDVFPISLVKGFFYLAANISSEFLWMFFIWIAFTSIGLFVLHRFVRSDADKEDSLITAFAIGAFVISTLLFFLGAAEILSRWSALAVIGGVMLIARKELLSICVLHKLQIKLKRGDIWLALILLTFFGVNMLELLRPFPIGWDDLVRYQNDAKLIALNGSLPDGFPNPWGLILSLGYLITGRANESLTIGFLSALVAFVGLYRLIKMIFPNFEKAPLPITTLFVTMPAVYFQTAQDIKLDLALLAVLIAVIMTYLSWYQSRKREYLYISALLLGFAFAIKYTTFFALSPFFVLVAAVFFGARGAALFSFLALITFWHFSYLLNSFSDSSIVQPLSSYLYWPLVIISLFFAIRSYTRKVLFFLIALAVFILPLMPWFIKNGLEVKNISIQTLLVGKNYSDEVQLKIANVIKELPASQDQQEVLNKNPLPTPTGVREEMHRYIGYDTGPGKYLKLPLKITFNTTVSTQAVDVGFVWLAVIGGLFFITPWRKLKKNQVVTLAIVSVYWIFWAFLSSGIIWYAFPGFIGLSIIMAWQLEKVYLSRLRYIVLGIFILWFSIVMITRFDSFSNANSIAYALGASSKDETFEKMLPQFYELSKNINVDGGVYQIGTAMRYFIPQNARRVYFDQQLEQFTFLYKEGDRELTTKRLRKLGFRYLIVDLHTPDLDITPEKTLVKKFNKLLDYIGLDASYALVNENKELVYKVLRPDFGVALIVLDEDV